MYCSRCMSGTMTMKVGPRTVLLFRRSSISVMIDILVDFRIRVEDWFFKASEGSVGPRASNEGVDSSSGSFRKRRRSTLQNLELLRRRQALEKGIGNHRPSTGCHFNRHTSGALRKRRCASALRWPRVKDCFVRGSAEVKRADLLKHRFKRDRKSTRLNSSHVSESRMPSS